MKKGSYFAAFLLLILALSPFKFCKLVRSDHFMRPWWQKNYDHDPADSSMFNGEFVEFFSDGTYLFRDDRQDHTGSWRLIRDGKEMVLKDRSFATCTLKVKTINNRKLRVKAQSGCSAGQLEFVPSPHGNLTRTN